MSQAISAAQDTTGAGPQPSTGQTAALLAELVRGQPDAATLVDAHGRMRDANERAARLMGFGSREELLQEPEGSLQTRYEMFDASGAPLPPERLPGRQALRGERPEELLMRFRPRDGREERWVSMSALALQTGAEPLALYLFRDLTEQRRDQERLRALAEAGQLLGASLDYEQTLSAVARLMVPQVADWCGVEILEEDGTSRQLAVAHVDPTKVRYAHELRERFPPDPDAPSGVPHVLRTGRAEFIAEITDEMLAAVTTDAEQLRIVRELGLRSAMTVALVARGRILGALSLVAAESGRRYTESDLAFAQELAQRAALAVDNARLYRQAAAQRAEALAVSDTLQALIRSTPVAIRLLELDGTVRLWNSAAEQLFGWTSDEVLGQPIKVVPAERMDEFRAHMVRIGEGETLQGETLRRHKDGRLFEAAFWDAPVRAADGHVQCLSLVVDVSERHRAEQVARELAAAEAARAEITRVLDSVTDPFLAFDETWRVVYLNQKCAEFLGVEREAAVGQPVWELFPPSDRPLLERCRGVLEGGAPLAFEEPSPRRGTWFEVHAFPFKGGLSLYLRDVTQRKEAQTQLAQRAEELARSNQELEQFAYVASHDLQEPLRMVASYTQLLARRYKGRLDQDADDFVGFAVEGVTRMQRLIQDLLAYSRVGRGKPAVQVPLSRALAAARANLKAALEESGAQVETAGELPVCRGDETQLVQLFQNLLGNAVKFRAPGRTPHLRVSAEPAAGGVVQVCVEDNGIGIAPEYFERVFVIFQRLHGRGEYPGTGIGLAICKKIVERHGGRIWVESRPGEGSRFFFTLPAGDGETRDARTGAA